MAALARPSARALGHLALSNEAKWMAAVLAAGTKDSALHRGARSGVQLDGPTLSVLEYWALRLASEAHRNSPANRLISLREVRRSKTEDATSIFERGDST